MRVAIVCTGCDAAVAGDSRCGRSRDFHIAHPAQSLLLTGNRKLFGLDLNATQARAWLDDLLAVVSAAEALPAPEVASALTGAERLAHRTRTLPKHFLIWAALIAGVAIVAIGVVVAVAVMLLV